MMDRELKKLQGWLEATLREKARARDLDAQPRAHASIERKGQILAYEAMLMKVCEIRGIKPSLTINKIHTSVRSSAKGGIQHG